MDARRPTKGSGMDARRPTKEMAPGRGAAHAGAGGAAEQEPAGRAAGPAANRAPAGRPDGPGPPPDQLVLRSPAQFRALGHPLRHRLFNLLRQRPATLAQLASALGSTKGTIGYHVQLMVDAGVLRLAGTRRVRGGTERYYEPAGADVRHDPDSEARTSFLVQVALDEMLPHRPGDEDLAVLGHLRLTPAQARDVAARIERFARDELGAGGARGAGGAGAARGAHGAHGESHGLLLCLFRADIPILPPDPPG
jgi:DNA-binding transcriptional ArsR family regulator